MTALVPYQRFDMPRRFLRRAFTFTEILFAIMILGIGFIMVAAIFPAAIQQTEVTNQETIGASVARTGAAYINTAMHTLVMRGYISPSSIATLPLMRPTVFTTPVNYVSEPQLYIDTVLNPSPQSSEFQNIPALPVARDAGGNLIYLPLVCPGQMISMNGVGATNSSQVLEGPPPGWLVNGQTSPPVGMNGNYLGGYLWYGMCQNMIQASDPRFAWVAFYKQDCVVTTSAVPPLQLNSTNETISMAPYAQVVVIACQSRNRPVYTTDDLTVVSAQSTTTPSALEATLTNVSVNPPNNGSLASTITFTSQSDPGYLRAAEGAFLVVSNDSLQTANVYHGLLNGHVYRLGIQPDSVNSPNTWELAPGYDLSQDDLISLNHMSGANLQVYIVGRAPDPANPGQFTGPAQDIAVYSTYIPCSSF